MSLYNKYRPKTFDDIIGNEDIVSYLKGVIDEEDNRPHVFLLHGPTGCGKTTMARIISKDLGCSSINTREINTADFRGIDSVREMIRSSRYQGIGGGNRVWIIDEIHKMTTDAQNAMLKLLEDTTQNSYYILCTTDPNKLLPTVRGRTISLQVKPLQDNQMMDLLRRVVKEEGKRVKRNVYEQIVQDSFGFPRNALQILEKILKVDPEQQMKMAKESISEQSNSIQLCRALLSGSGWKRVSLLLKGIKDQDAESIRRHVLGYAQSILLNGTNDKAAHVLEEFIDPFYNSGFPGLVLACYSVIKG